MNIHKAYKKINRLPEHLFRKMILSRCVDFGDEWLFRFTLKTKSNEEEYGGPGSGVYFVNKITGDIRSEPYMSCLDKLSKGIEVDISIFMK